MRSGALLLVPLLLVAGCGGADGGDAASPDGSGTSTSSPASTPSESPSAGAPSEGADPGPARLPGGSAGRSVLARDWLDRSGRLTDGRRAPTAGVQRAICGYLFGTPAQVGRVARLPGTVTLAPRSGYAGLGSDGVGFQCGYDVGGTTVYSLAVWSKRARRHLGTGRPPGRGAGRPRPLRLLGVRPDVRRGRGGRRHRPPLVAAGRRAGQPGGGVSRPSTATT